MAQEFACKMCFEPLDIDSSFMENLDNIKQLLSNPFERGGWPRANKTARGPALPGVGGVAMSDSSFEVMKRKDLLDQTPPPSPGPVLGDSKEKEPDKEKEPPPDTAGPAEGAPLDGSPAVEDGRRKGAAEVGLKSAQSQITLRRGPAAGGSVSGKIFEVFQLATDLTEVDYPLCDVCTEVVVQDLNKRLEELKNQFFRYEEFDKQLDSEEDHTAKVNFSEIHADIRKLEEEEQELKRKLLEIQKETEMLEEAKESLEKDLQAIAEIEQQYWSNHNLFQDQFLAFQEERCGIKANIDSADSQLDILKRTNVFNDAFHIWHDGHFATINGYRLGCLPAIAVTWEEINAAWGQTVLLLHTLSSQLGFKFSTYRLIYMGSSSRIMKLDDQGIHQLYGTSNYMNALERWMGGLDKAMIAFLKCMKELSDHVQSQDRSFKLPYRMEHDKIGENGNMLTIKYQPSGLDKWTKALKYLLTNLKWLLAWMARRQ